VRLNLGQGVEVEMKNHGNLFTCKGTSSRYLRQIFQIKMVTVHWMLNETCALSLLYKVGRNIFPSLVLLAQTIHCTFNFC